MHQHGATKCCTMDRQFCCGSMGGAAAVMQQAAAAYTLSEWHSEPGQISAPALLNSHDNR